MSTITIRGTLLVDKARELIGYNPSYPIDIGMPEYIQWYQDFFSKLKV